MTSTAPPRSTVPTLRRDGTRVQALPGGQPTNMSWLTPESRSTTSQTTAGQRSIAPTPVPEPRSTTPELAAERRPAYDLDTGNSADSGDVAVPSLRDAVGDAVWAMRRALEIATCDGAVGEGEIGALLDLAGALDAGHAAAVAVADRIETGGLAERRMGLPLENVLAMRSKWTFGDRRTLVNVEPDPVVRTPEL